ncbi:Protein TIC 20-II- chloroplastic [Striga hermonthica]|uniref:Protein TIC 20 n=1 Tax=Striga hermonthica TaxID=68872 RepID=A0A9N7NCT1_STRHE|nr:Protein TIC 20-II- chloroplastic [Striga hermonthica]
MASSIPFLSLSIPLHHRNHRSAAVLLPPPPLRGFSSANTPIPAADRLTSAGSNFLPLLNDLQYGRFRSNLPPPPLRRRCLTKTSASSHTPVPAADRLISAASYFLPLFNGLQYGRFLFATYPIAAAPFEPLLPLLSLYHSALVLDVLLVLPVLLQRIIAPGRSGIALKLTAWAYSGLFVFVVACFVYGLVSSVLGKTPYLPLVAQAAGRQLD